MQKDIIRQNQANSTENSNVIAIEQKRDILKATGIRQAAEEFIFGHLPDSVDKATKEFLVALCVNLRLNPFKREIHFIPFKDKITPVVSYLVYIRRACESGKLDGWEVELEEKGGKPFSATCVVYRKDWSRPFKWTVHFNEVKRRTHVWDEMPGFMLKKVAIAQAFRLAFPEEVGELPYTEEEAPVIEGEIVDTFPSSEGKPFKSPSEETPKEDLRVAQARKLAEAKGVEMDAEPTDSEWVQLYTSGILTGRLAKGQKMSALLARLRNQKDEKLAKDKNEQAELLK